jgi:cell division protease FtsH
MPSKNVSEETAQIIDEEVRRLVDEGFASAKKILTKRKKDLEAIAQGLLEYETLTGSEIDELMDGKPPSRDMGDDTPPSRGSAVPKTGTKPSKGQHNKRLENPNIFKERITFETVVRFFVSSWSLSIPHLAAVNHNS